MTETSIKFSQGRPFFDMVGSFMISLAGAPSVMNEDNPMKLTEGHFISLPGILTPGRHIRPFEIHNLVRAGNISMGRYLKTCCGMLANAAYESVKQHNDRSREFEFFRHIRNAASHGNKFHFVLSEPVRPASWRATSIDSSEHQI